MRGLPSILSVFRKEINEINNTGARMLYSVSHIRVFCAKTLRFCHKNPALLLPSIHNVTKICKSILMHSVMIAFY